MAGRISLRWRLPAGFGGRGGGATAPAGGRTADDGRVPLGGRGFDLRGEQRQQRRQHDVTGQQAQQQTAAGDQAQLGGPAERGQHGDQKRPAGPEAGGVDRGGHVLEDGGPDGPRVAAGVGGVPHRLLAVAGQHLDQVVHADADQGDQEHHRQQIQIAAQRAVERGRAERGPAERPADADQQGDLGGHGEPDRAEEDRQPDEDGRERDDLGLAAVLVGGAQLVGVEGRPAGQADGEVIQERLGGRLDVGADAGDHADLAVEAGQLPLLEHFDEQQALVGLLGVGDVGVAQVARRGRAEGGQVGHLVAQGDRPVWVGDRLGPADGHQVGQLGRLGGQLLVRGAAQAVDEPLQRRGAELAVQKVGLLAPAFDEGDDPLDLLAAAGHLGRVVGEQQALAAHLLDRDVGLGRADVVVVGRQLGGDRVGHGRPPADGRRVRLVLRLDDDVGRLVLGEVFGEAEVVAEEGDVAAEQLVLVGRDVEPVVGERDRRGDADEAQHERPHGVADDAEDELDQVAVEAVGATKHGREYE